MGIGMGMRMGMGMRIGSGGGTRWRLGGAILTLSESSNNGSNDVRAITRNDQVDEDEDEEEDEDEDDDRSVYYDI